LNFTKNEPHSRKGDCLDVKCRTRIDHLTEVKKRCGIKEPTIVTFQNCVIVTLSLIFAVHHYWGN